MPPDFNKNTIETLARRAAYKCSNPDCRISTVGPNSDPNRATVLGEAAHIFGARPKSKRYDPRMSNQARAEITNGIWLCRNCHKLVDSDDQEWPAEILFSWREIHEKHVLSELGNSTERLRFEHRESQLSGFEGYPPLIRRIILDKPRGWEWSVTAELMRYLNDPIFRKFADLRDGLYVGPQEHLLAEDVSGWVQDRMTEYQNLITPFTGLMQRLSASWGEPGQEGDVGEIHHICLLIRNTLQQVVLFEEEIHFANAPEEYARVLDLLKGILSSQAEKLAEIPGALDVVVATVTSESQDHTDTPREFRKVIEFELPRGWVRRLTKELRRANRKSGVGPGKDDIGCVTSAVVIAIVIWIIGSLV